MNRLRTGGAPPWTGIILSSLVLLGLAATWPPRATAAGVPNASPSEPRALSPEWKRMDYGPFLSLTLEVGSGNIAHKGIAVRLDRGSGGVASGHDFFLFETDTLRAAAGWTGSEFIDWKNIAFDGTHEVHAKLLGDVLFSNPDAAGWANPAGQFGEERILGRDGQRYGPLPRGWAHWRGLYLHGDQVIFSYTVGDTDVLESPGLEEEGTARALSRTFSIGRRAQPLRLQVAAADVLNLERGSSRVAAGSVLLALATREAGRAGTNLATAIVLVGGPPHAEWQVDAGGLLRLQIPAGPDRLRLKLLYMHPTQAPEEQAAGLAQSSSPPLDLSTLLHGGPSHWSQTVTTRVERIPDPRLPYQAESITVPFNNPYRSWMRTSAFDFFSDGRRAAVCTWQGDVWTVDGLGGALGSLVWKRIAAGLFQPLGLKLVEDQIFLTCRDQITVLRDLNGDGEADFFENFNNDAQVTEHFHEFAMDLQTGLDGRLYYAKGGRHAKDALVPQHGTLLAVSPDGARTDVIASGFRAPNGVCVNGDGTFFVSDQEGHWTPENRINWVKPGGFYGYMMGYHSGRSADDYEPPAVWIHKSMDRSPAEPLWVTSDRWGPLRGQLISLSYGTGKILQVLTERVGEIMQGGVVALPVAPLPTGIMRGRFHPGDGQLYAAGLFGWAGDRTRPGGFYRIRYTGGPVCVPVMLQATRQGMLIRFAERLDAETAGDPQNYAISRWTYRRTANYGSDDYRISRPGERGRDPVVVSAAKVSRDRRSVLLEIPDQQPCMQMEIKYAIQSERGTPVTQLMENTIRVVGGDATLDP